MNKRQAINLLIAVACCSVVDLSCYDCPYYNADKECRSWLDEEVKEAVNLLNKEKNK